MNLCIHSTVLNVIEELNRAGFQAYVVGGAVRDLLLGRTPQDWDVTTDARAEQVQALFPRTFATGLKHGTVTVRMGGLSVEVTTYRVDGTYQDHRRPQQVQFTNRLEEDLQRRDFTINGMAYHPSEGLVDPFGGRGDLRAGVVRAIGRGEERFREDALRMLRAVRFAAQLDFAIEPATYRAIQSQKQLLPYISGERIREELTKFLLAGRQLELLNGTGIQQVLLPELPPGCGWERVAQAAPSTFVVRWSALLCPAREQVHQVIRRLRFDRRSASHIAALVEWFQAPLPRTPQEVRRAAAQLGRERFPLWLDLQQAAGDLAQRDAVQACKRMYHQCLEQNCPLTVGEMAITGRDLLELGYTGPEVGDKLSRLFDRVLAHPEENTRETLCKLAEKQE